MKAYYEMKIPLKQWFSIYLIQRDILDRDDKQF